MNERILEILLETRPESDFESSADFLLDGLLDSFDMIVLIASLESAFGVVIDGARIVPEQFVSVESIAELVETSPKRQ